MDFWKSKDTLFLLMVFSVGFIIILISKFIGSLIPDEFAYKTIAKIFTLLLKEGGIALMIASILGYTVEAMSRKKQEEEVNNFIQLISEDVLSAVFKKIVPDPIFDQIKTAVLEETVIKKDAVLTCDLYHLSENDIANLKLTKDEAANYLKCEMTSTYTLINLSEVPIKSHRVQSGTSCDLDGEFYSHLKIHSVVIKDELDQSEVDACLDRKQDGRLHFSKEINLAGKSNGGENGIPISFCYSTFKRINDADVWSTVLPTENMTLNVNYPDGFKVGATSQHPSPLTPLPVNLYANRVGYELKKGIFPYQGISYWWRKN